MNRGFEPVVGQPVQHIAHVHHQLVGQGGDGYPGSVAAQHLQPFGTGPHEQRDQVYVAVGGGTHGIGRHLFGILNGEIMDGPQNAVAVFYFAVEIMLVQAQVQRNGLEHGRAGLFELPVHRQAGFAQAGKFAWKNIVRIFGLDRVVTGHFLPDVVELLEVGRFEAFGGFLAPANVAALAVQFRKPVLFLGLTGCVKKRLEIAVQLFRQLFGQVMVFNGDKADAVERLAQLGHKPGFALRIAGSEVRKVE